MYSWDRDLVKGIERKNMNGVSVKVYRDRPPHLIQALTGVVSRCRNKTALIDEQRTLTYGEFDRITASWAQRLLADYGIGKGDRVALLMRNTVGFCAAAFAVLKAGGIVVPLNTKLKPFELNRLLALATPSLLIANDDLYAGLAAQIAYQGTVIGEDELFSSEKQTMTGAPGVFPEIDEHDPAFILFTSGTTGQPKGAVISHFNIVHAAINYERCYGLSEADSTIIAVPIFHGTGLFAQLTTFLYLGGTIVLQNVFHPETMLRLCEQHRVTHTIVVPTIYTKLLQVPDHRAYRLWFRVLGSGGAPLPEMLFHQLREWLPQAKLINTYGLTEATSPAIIMPHEMAAQKCGTVGIPSPVTEVRVVDPLSGEVLPPGQAGELLLKGPLIVSGYWKNADATAKAFHDGWLHTGDIAVMDADGFVSIKDRLKEMINRGGEKIYSAEVENVLYNHPGVLEVAVVGVADPVYGEAVMAFVVPKAGENLTEHDIQEWAARYLAKYKVPQYVAFIDSLPRNAGGKVIKSQLKANKSQYGCPG